MQPNKHILPKKEIEKKRFISKVHFLLSYFKFFRKVSYTLLAFTQNNKEYLELAVRFIILLEASFRQNYHRREYSYKNNVGVG